MTKLNRNGVMYEFVCPNCGKGTLRSILQTVAVWDYTDMEVYSSGEISMDADNYTEVDEAGDAVVGCKACRHVLEGVTAPEEIIKDDRFWRKICTEDSDIHTGTAAEIFRVVPKDVTPEMRTQGKRANFNKLYGGQK